MLSLIDGTLAWLLRMALPITTFLHELSFGQIFPVFLRALLRTSVPRSSGQHCRRPNDRNSRSKWKSCHPRQLQHENHRSGPRRAWSSGSVTTSILSCCDVFLFQLVTFSIINLVYQGVGRITQSLH